ncbi:FAD-dependent oxidoreductase [Mycolicibacterium sp. P9-64]|uniref:GcvT family protein n=1 Tax=Mycolicibacterium sp. P9-64 TaxID=2024612 RepID=UPI0011EEE058|nr:FAD-dependent oxidoreductase [Mycolicibacterium sp. P9-64]KAA0084566.1 FAD-dependent oxidoreductase [Mycolicibacterium sp. P9-64]
MRAVPDRAQVVIVGGGVVGASVAYHLAKRGCRDVVLLEQNELTSGTTWHAAGLVTQARGTDGTRQVVKRSLEVFNNLEADTGFSTGFVATGTINIATTPDRVDEQRHQMAGLRSSGVRADFITTDRILELHPYLNPEGILGGLWFPEDGRGNATDTTMSLIRGAQRGGTRVFEHTRVTGTTVTNGRVTGVTTEFGAIEAEFVVNCTGMWGREFAAQIGVDIPLQALAHYYVVTDEIKDLQKNLPTVKSGEDHSYLKDEVSALMVGFFEPGSYAWASRGIPKDKKSFIQLPEDWDHLGPFYEKMIERVPILADAGIRLHFCGPESFTPDGMYHLGEAPNVRNYFIAAGFNSVGFLSGPGAGSVIADWILDGTPSIDLPEADPGRTQPHEVNRRFLEKRAVEYLDESYEIHWPFQQKATARGLRKSPLYHRTEAAGAVFGELAGWERANWYAPPGVPRCYDYSFGRQNWFAHSAEEHQAVREAVGMLDLSSFGKILVQGRDAQSLLSRLSVNNVDFEPGRIVYTQWLNPWGGIEADVTVTRWSEDEWVVLSGPATVNHDLAWMRRQVAPDEFVTIADITGTHSMLAVMGPEARNLLQSLSDADLSNDAFPFGTTRVIDLGMTFVRATRMTYVGELGWELLVPTEYSDHVFDTIVGEGTHHGLKLAGYHAMNSLRMEKGYRSWGHDISAKDTPLEAGLGFTVKWDKKGGFIGRDALLAQRERGVGRRLVQFVLTDPDPLLVHDEPIYRDGELVGRVASAMYGHTLGGSVALGWVTAPAAGIERDWFTHGSYEIEVATDRFKADASLRPLYDPKSERPKS